MINDLHPFLTLVCSHCGRPLKVRLSCGDRTCPTCRAKWFGYHFKPILEVVTKWKSVYFMTLTLRNIPDSAFGRYDVKGLRESFGKLRKRFKEIAGGFYVVQVTNNGKGWHLHLHVLFDGSFIAQKALSKAWAEITKGSYIVGIEQVRDRREAVRYLLKDFLQSPKIRPEDRESFNGVFKGSRLVQPFGDYRNTKFRVPYKCPDCGRTEWVDLELLLGNKRSRLRHYDEDS